MKVCRVCNIQMEDLLRPEWRRTSCRVPEGPADSTWPGVCEDRAGGVVPTGCGAAGVHQATGIPPGAPFIRRLLYSPFRRSPFACSTLECAAECEVCDLHMCSPVARIGSRWNVLQQDIVSNRARWPMWCNQRDPHKLCAKASLQHRRKKLLLEFVRNIH
jgi:hypothetical protein